MASSYWPEATLVRLSARFAVPFAVNEVTSNEALAPAGNPETARFTALESPPIVTETAEVTEPLNCTGMVSRVGSAVRVTVSCVQPGKAPASTRKSVNTCLRLVEDIFGNPVHFIGEGSGIGSIVLIRIFV